MITLLILLIPFLGTSLGSATVFFLKDRLPERLEKALLGFASGLMIAASVWSLLIPAVEMSEISHSGFMSVIPAAVGFLAGIGCFLLTDTVVSRIHTDPDRPKEVGRIRLPKNAMMLFAVTLHTIPEGMAVGAACAGSGAAGSLPVAATLALSVGIAIQNFPEGAIVSLPLCGEGVSRSRSFLSGVFSGAVEPIGAILTLLFASIVTPLLPYFLSFAAGAMIYVVVEELIPDVQSGGHSCLGTVGIAIGFIIMMILDVVLA